MSHDLLVQMAYYDNNDNDDVTLWWSVTWRVSHRKEDNDEDLEEEMHVCLSEGLQIE